MCVRKRERKLKRSDVAVRLLSRGVAVFSVHQTTKLLTVLLPSITQAGENVGLLLRGIKREDVFRGQVICKPGSVQTYKVGCLHAFI